MPHIGIPELLIILVIALLIFGAKRLPEIAKGIGKSVVEFKKSLKDVTDEGDKIKDTVNSIKQIK